MRIKFLILMFCLTVLSCSDMDNRDSNRVSDFNNTPEPPKNTEFILAAGDEVNINVWRDTSLTRLAKLDPAGFISFPLLGEIKAEGMTVSQLRKEITHGLGKYIRQPYVDVNIASVVSKKVYVLGEVRTPGKLVMDAPMTVWEALARTGGFSENANKKYAVIVRQENGRIRAESVDMDISALYKGNFAGNYFYLHNNDIVYIPEEAISTVEKFAATLTSIIKPIIAIESGIVLGDTVNKIFQNQDMKNTNVNVAP